MSLVIFCLLFSSIDYVPVKGEIIWYLSLTAWLISKFSAFYDCYNLVDKEDNGVIFSRKIHFGN